MNLTVRLDIPRTIFYCQLVVFGYYSEGVPNKQWLRIFKGREGEGWGALCT